MMWAYIIINAVSDKNAEISHPQQSVGRVLVGRNELKNDFISMMNIAQNL